MTDNRSCIRYLRNGDDRRQDGQVIGEDCRWQSVRGYEQLVVDKPQTHRLRDQGYQYGQNDMYGQCGGKCLS